MARLRPGRTCRSPNSQAWARYSLRKPKKNYIRALPHTSIQAFDTGADKPEYSLVATLETQYPIQLRSNALESARISIVRYMDENAPQAYYMKLLVFPHNVIREHKMAAGAGADRISRGMSLAFGRPVSVAARIRGSQPVFMVKTTKENREFAVKALSRASSKLSGAYKVRVAAAQ